MVDTAYADRLWAKVDRSGGPEGCWPWTGCRRNEGYGLFRLNGRREQAHRVTYELLVGPIPEGLQIDHLCRNKTCVNPAHLEPVTAGENSRRRDMAHPRPTHCKWGHEFTPENTYMRPDRPGHRCCRICVRNRSRRVRAA